MSNWADDSPWGLSLWLLKVKLKLKRRLNRWVLMNALANVIGRIGSYCTLPIHLFTQADLQEKAHSEQLQQEAQKTQNLLDEITKIKEIAKEKVSFHNSCWADNRQR
jgi:hypothetical protein